MIELRANPGPTGRMLAQLLQARGLMTGAPQGRVNYGYGGQTTLPTLNRKAGTFNKLQELTMLAAKNVSVVPFDRNGNLNAHILMGRQLHHTRGRDIIQMVGPISARTAATRDFWTALIPKRREFRVWGFRRTCIGVYEKTLHYPRKLGRRGRSREVWNWRNGYGYGFVHPDQCPKELRELGAMAVDAVGLDFGAADIIQGQDGRYYVLEVNSAPGVEGPRQAMTSLVNHIERWAHGGFRRRNGEEPHEHAH